MSQVWWAGGAQQGLLVQHPLYVPLSLPWHGKHLFTKPLLYLSSSEFSSFPLKPQIPIPFSLAQDGT